MAQLSIFAPRLFADEPGQIEPNAGPSAWPKLHALLARSRAWEVSNDSIENALFALCACGHDAASVAALTAGIDYRLPAAQNILRADPVYLRADPNQVLLFNHPSIMPSTAEADELLSALDTSLPECKFSRGRHPGRWYFELDLHPDTTTSSPSLVDGRSIAQFMPAGPDAQSLAQLMNEAQMVLNDLAVNREREAKGIAPINSIWPWRGTLSAQPARRVPDLLIGDDVLCAAIARQLECDWLAELPPQEVISRARSRDGHVLVVLGSPNGCIDGEPSSSAIDAFEHEWADLLATALRRFRIARVQLITNSDHFELTPWDMLKVWRTKSPRRKRVV